MDQRGQEWLKVTQLVMAELALGPVSSRHQNSTLYYVTLKVLNNPAVIVLRAIVH